MSPQLRVFVSGHDGPLDVAGIETDLAALWKEASSEGKEPAMRASRANLVVLLSSPDPSTSGQARLEELLPAIARLYPSRALVVTLGAHREAGTLCASVSALCALGDGARYVCCERISLEASPGTEASVPGAVLSLLLGELPVVIWVPGKDVPLAASWFRTMLDSADRLVLDSGLLPIPSATLRALRHLTSSFRTIDFVDFEWLRLVPWRRQITEAFDRAPAREAAREGFERVTFYEPALPSSRHGAHGPQTVIADESPAENAASAASLLLRSWIAARASVRAFAWSEPDAVQGDLAAEGPSSHPLQGIGFEGRVSGQPFRLVVKAPAAIAEPFPDDLARLIGGQPDNPLHPHTLLRPSR